MSSAGTDYFDEGIRVLIEGLSECSSQERQDELLRLCEQLQRTFAYDTIAGPVLARLRQRPGSEVPAS